MHPAVDHRRRRCGFNVGVERHGAVTSTFRLAVEQGRTANLKLPIVRDLIVVRSDAPAGRPTSRRHRTSIGRSATPAPAFDGPVPGEAAPASFTGTGTVPHFPEQQRRFWALAGSGRPPLSLFHRRHTKKQRAALITGLGADRRYRCAQAIPGWRPRQAQRQAVSIDTAAGRGPARPRPIRSTLPMHRIGGGQLPVAEILNSVVLSMAG